MEDRSHIGRRDFDLLNGNLITIFTTQSMRTISVRYERRRNSYGNAPILLNATSQDEGQLPGSVSGYAAVRRQQHDRWRPDDISGTRASD